MTNNFSLKKKRFQPEVGQRDLSLKELSQGGKGISRKNLLEDFFRCGS
jgi:hypothetical protein